MPFSLLCTAVHFFAHCVSQLVKSNGKHRNKSNFTTFHHCLICSVCNKRFCPSIKGRYHTTGSEGHATGCASLSHRVLGVPVATLPERALGSMYYSSSFLVRELPGAEHPSRFSVCSLWYCHKMSVARFGICPPPLLQQLRATGHHLVP